MPLGHRRPALFTLIAIVLALGALAGVSSVAGFESVGRVFASTHLDWLAACAITQVVAYAGYVVAYRSVARMQQGPSLGLSLTTLLVVAGFGGFAIGGGFAIDRRALHAVCRDRRDATVRVIGLGVVEYAILAPVAAAAAVVLLLTGARTPESLTLPWAIGVPVGFAVAFWIAAPARGPIPRPGSGRLREGFEHLLEGLGVLHRLVAEPFRHPGAWIGTALYWSAEIACLYAALRTFGAHVPLAALIIAYATGYAASKRSLPLGGAGVTEALMAFALTWVGVPLAPALGGVVIYRGFNFLLPLVPALVAHTKLKPLLERAVHD